MLAGVLMTTGLGDGIDVAKPCGATVGASDTPSRSATAHPLKPGRVPAA